jgi:hypothetical protein
MVALILLSVVIDLKVIVSLARGLQLNVTHVSDFYVSRNLSFPASLAFSFILFINFRAVFLLPLVADADFLNFCLFGDCS